MRLAATLMLLRMIFFYNQRYMDIPLCLIKFLNEAFKVRSSIIEYLVHGEWWMKNFQVLWEVHKPVLKTKQLASYTNTLLIEIMLIGISCRIGMKLFSSVLAVHIAHPAIITHLTWTKNATHIHLIISWIIIRKNKSKKVEK